MVCNGWAAGPETWALTTFPRDWTFDYLEQLAGLPERVLTDFDEVLLIGFSMGSQTALDLYLKYPEKVKGLVLISATPRMMADEGWPGFSPRRLEALRLGTEMVYRNNPSPLYAPENLHRGLEWLERTDLRERLEARPNCRDSINPLPVAILHSERDGIVRPHNAEYLHQLFPGSKVTMVPGNEHVLPVTAAHLVDKAVYEIMEYHKTLN